MTRFSNDVDLLKREPVLFRDLARSSQTLGRGSDGVTSGTSFTSDSADFTAAQVEAGQVICLSDESGATEGAYEIISVESATELRISVVRGQETDEAVAPPEGSDLAYRISTFNPQAEEAGRELREYFGLREVEDEADIAAAIAEDGTLRQASIFAVLAAVFAGAAGGEQDGSGYWEKSRHYQQQFYRARERAQISIDEDGDGRPEDRRNGGTIRLRRA
jgi:hypothetical protein